MLTEAQRAAFERKLRDAFQGAMGNQARELFRLMGEPPDVSRVPAEFWQRLDKRMQDVIEPIMLDMAITSAFSVGQSAGIQSAVNWTAVNERAASWASRYTFDLVRGINSTTRNLLQAEISRFYRDASVDLKSLAARLQAGLPDLMTRLHGIVSSADRAQLIATTEVTRAAAEGEQALVDRIKADNRRVNVGGVFLTSNDEIVCQKICVPLNGVQDDGKGNFVNPRDGQVYRIPAHPGCRCGRGTIILGL